MDKDRPGYPRPPKREVESPLDSELQLVRSLDGILRNRYPEGVSLLQKLEGGKVLELHRRIRQPFNPHACARSEELTQYLWAVGRTVALEPGGGITVSGGGSIEKYVLGRAFYKEAEIEYGMLHRMIAEALGKDG